MTFFFNICLYTLCAVVYILFLVQYMNISVIVIVLFDLSVLCFSSIGMAKAALDAIHGLNMFGEGGSSLSIIHVDPDAQYRNHVILSTLLPRESRQQGHWCRPAVHTWSAHSKGRQVKEVLWWVEPLAGACNITCAQGMSSKPQNRGCG